MAFSTRARTSARTYERLFNTRSTVPAGDARKLGNRLNGWSFVHNPSPFRNCSLYYPASLCNVSFLCAYYTIFLCFVKTQSVLSLFPCIFTHSFWCRFFDIFGVLYSIFSFFQNHMRYSVFFTECVLCATYTIAHTKPCDHPRFPHICFVFLSLYAFTRILSIYFDVISILTIFTQANCLLTFPYPLAIIST